AGRRWNWPTTRCWPMPWRAGEPFKARPPRRALTEHSETEPMSSGFGMRMDLSPRQEQRLLLAPRMIQSMEILQLPIVDLQAKIDKELQENPFLEVKEHLGEQDETAEPEFNPDAPLKHDESGDLEFNRLEALNRDWDDHFNEEHRASRAALDEEGDRKLDAMANMPDRPQSLQDHLAEQPGEVELDEA